MIPFMSELGYELNNASAEIINGKSYAISHRASNCDGFPVHIVGINQSLDKKPETSTTRLSPHALIQEYLNNHDHLFALTTNGKVLRLLRDATRLSRLSYLEFNLEQIMTEDLFGEFALLYRLLHFTRMPKKQDEGEESIIEFYHQESLNSGSRIREKLSKAVEKSINKLGNGILKHRENQKLRDAVHSGSLTADDYYLTLLRLVYRLLFLLVIEERHLVYAETKDPDIIKKRNIYYKYYSLNRLTSLAEKQIYIDPHKTDLWKSLIVTFQIFEKENFANHLAIKPLGSGLFAVDALGELENQTLDNGTLLEVLSWLVTFENQNRQKVRVNYADLDVEEFGSVYEGLLEYDPVFNAVSSGWEFSFVQGDQRSRSGSHYTPEELVKPLLEHSLEYLIKDCIEKPETILNKNGTVIARSGFNPTKQSQQELALLSLKVADVACGSGHILLSSARRIGLELARVRSNEDQPSPPVMRQATRDVIRNCIYGVDLNPLAVELCKVALWLEAHSPGEPLNFLDHHIKCGNAIVGLAHKEELQQGIPDEAFKTLAGDDKKVAQALKKANKKERERKGQINLNFDKVVEDPLHEILEKWEAVNAMPEQTPEEIAKKETAYRSFANGPKWWRLKTLADLPVAQFFIPKTDNKFLTTDGLYREFLRGNKSLECREASTAVAMSQKKRFFHWFLEFPEVFTKGGFDCIVGNPPFLGRRKITGTFSNSFLEIWKYLFKPIGAEDLVTYFFRRIYNLIDNNGFMSLISTNTISQGGARKYGLEIILKNGGRINHAISSMKWPGNAAVEISLVSITNRKNIKCILNRKKKERISSYLDDSLLNIHPQTLKMNKNKSFKGSEPAGTGFILSIEHGKKIISKDSKYNKVVKYYLNGNDLNNSVLQEANRMIIDFFDRTEVESKQFELCYDIVKEKVKPDRQRWKIDDEGNEIVGKYALRKPLPQKWWIYGEKRPKLYKTISNFSKVLVIARTSKTGAFCFVTCDQVLNANLSIIAFNDSLHFCILQSSMHISWAWKYATKMKTDLIYQPSDVFETYPFPQKLLYEFENQLETIGNEYHDFRQQLMQKIQLGLTKTYNAFHAQEIQPGITASQLSDMQQKDIEKQLGKEVWYLWNHLQKTDGTCSIEEAIADIVTLRRLHKEMDEAVLEAYGWHTNSDKWGPAIDLAHDFYEVDYLPENDRVRYTISPTARKEVLKRLLLLNHEIFEEEVKQGLHTKADVEKFYAQKGEPVPDGIEYSDGKGKKKVVKKKENKDQLKMF
ncbi:MAG: restriction endonuclease [Candidatus Marinimicrobia bacterium]|nr:restriction endonuclease [Candidatus Neomarinimicrobiota bacterium]